MEIGNNYRARGVVVTFFLLMTSAACASGLSNDSKILLIESLRNYEPLPMEERRSRTDSEEEKYCRVNDGIHLPVCLERKYMKEGSYLVHIAYTRERSIPTQPKTYRIPNVVPYERDTTERDSFLSEWSDAVFSEYIGEDYRRFNSISLDMVNKRAVVITLQVINADELVGVLDDSRILYVHHVANPVPALEEITN